MKQRSLALDSLEQVEHEVRSLLASGYTSTGKWDLAQTCAHLNDWMRFPMDGFPKPGMVGSLMMGILKRTMGRRMLQGILANGFKPGGPTMPQTVHDKGASTDEQAVEGLLKTLSRFTRFSEPFFPSPLFGEMDQETTRRLQLAHCAHHLSFLWPKNE